jgi:hypothetical protein
MIEHVPKPVCLTVAELKSKLYRRREQAIETLMKINTYRLYRNCGNIHSLPSNANTTAN